MKYRKCYNHILKFKKINIIITIFIKDIILTINLQDTRAKIEHLKLEVHSLKKDFNGILALF